MKLSYLYLLLYLLVAGVSVTDGEVLTREGAVQLTEDSLIFLAALFIENGAVVVAVFDSGAGCGDMFSFNNAHLAVGGLFQSEAEDEGVVVSGVGVASEGPVAHGVIDVLVLVYLIGLKSVGVASVNEVRTFVYAGVSQLDLVVVDGVAAFVAPVHGGDDEIGLESLESCHSVFDLGGSAEGEGVNADAKSAFGFNKAILGGAAIKSTARFGLFFNSLSSKEEPIKSLPCRLFFL